MTYKSFEEYLMGYFMDSNITTDDLLPDMYEDWIVEQDVEDVIRLANLYGEHKVIEGVSGAIKKLEESMED